LFSIIRSGQACGGVNERTRETARLGGLARSSTNFCVPGLFDRTALSALSKSARLRKKPVMCIELMLSLPRIILTEAPLATPPQSPSMPYEKNAIRSASFPSAAVTVSLTQIFGTNPSGGFTLWSTLPMTEADDSQSASTDWIRSRTSSLVSL